MTELLCPSCRTALAVSFSAGRAQCDNGHAYPVTKGVLDLVGDLVADRSTAEHYTKQWGAALGMGHFLKSNAIAAAVTPGKQLGWSNLFAQIRDVATLGSTSVYDAGCGFGGVFSELFAAPAPAHLEYVGADIHGALGDIAMPEDLDRQRCMFVRWDISEPFPGRSKFDFIVCRAAIHHTAWPDRTFASLVSMLKKGGRLAVSAYARKAPMREAIDDLFRNSIRDMSPDKALEVCGQFTALGKALQASGGAVEIPCDLPFLGIKQGTYGVQEFVYDHFLKCWFNREFGDAYSDVVNYDWYHPTYAFRYHLSELQRWFEASGVQVTHTASIKAQHYVEGVLR